MKKYTILSLVLGTIFMISCTKNKSDIAVQENDPSGDYLYTGNTKYYSSNNDLEYEGATDGYMYINWYSGSETIDIQVTPSIGYYYYLQASNLETHGDTTTFRISAQVVEINGVRFNVSGTNAISVPNLGSYDGYYVQDKKIEYAFRSTNIESYESSENTTIGSKRN